MENVATVEQAEPQGSAAPSVAVAPADRGPSPQPPASGLDRMRAVFEAKAARAASAQPAATETSAADEQPASDASQSGTPEASATGTDQPTDPTQPKLSRAQRKAQRQATAEAPPSPATPAPAETVTSGTTQAQQGASPASPADPIERVERTLADAIARIEARLPNPEQPAAPTAPQQSDADADYYGDDAEFVRLATIATRPNASNEWLSNEDANKLETWSLRREARDRARAQSDQDFRASQTQIALAAAEAHGIDQQSLFSAQSMRAIYDTFVDRGRAIEREASAARDTASAQEIERLKGINQELADQLEAYERRAPGYARPLVAGGMSAASRNAALAERARMSGTDRLRAALSSTGRRGRPGGR